MSVNLLTEHHLEFLSLKRGCTGLSESTLVKMPHCWKSHVAAQKGLYTHTPEEVFLSFIIGGKKLVFSILSVRSGGLNLSLLLSIVDVS